MRDLIYMYFTNKMVEFSCFIYNMCTRCPKKTKIVVVVLFFFIYIYIQLKLLLLSTQKILNVWKKQTTILVAPILNVCLIE